MLCKHCAVTEIYKRTVFLFLHFDPFSFVALLHQHGNMPLQGQRHFWALRDKTIKLIVLQTADELFPLDSLSFHNYRRGEGFYEETNWWRRPGLIFIFLSVIRPQHESHPEAVLFAFMKGTSRRGKWRWNRLVILQSRQKRWKPGVCQRLPLRTDKDEDAKTERVMAEHQLPLPRQIELLGSVTV